MEENYEIDAISDSPSRILSPVYFPSDVKKWMKKNAKPKMALKLMHLCKYFQHSDGFPYLVVKNVLGDGLRWYLDRLDGRKEIKNTETITPKLWIIEMVDLSFDPKAASKLLTKIAVCAFKKIKLSGQQITLEEFKLLTDGGMVEECHIMESSITSENGEIIPLEDIFECLPNARIITFGQETPSIFSLEAAERKISSKLEKLSLWIPPENFDHQKLLAYMKNHQNVHYRFWYWGITEECYTENVAPAINKLMQEWPAQYKKPDVFRFRSN